MNIQKYIGHDGQPTHICFSFHVVAHDKTNWAARLELAIAQSRIRTFADVEIIAGRIVADKNMVKVYLLFSKTEYNLGTSILHVTGFANVLGVHGFAAAGSVTELNFINA
jgi:hypothetical protein